ncbi:MAG: hypothetical protein AAGI72_01545 [Pseudomonadota bacterium]
MKQLRKISLAIAALSISGTSFAGTPVDFGNGDAVLECVPFNSDDTDGVRDTHPDLPGGLTEGTNSLTRVNSVCVVQNGNSLTLVDVASNGSPIDTSALSINRGNNCKGPARLINAGITEDARYVFATYEWVGRDQGGPGPFAGSFAVAWKLVPKSGGGGRPVPSGNAQFLGDTLTAKNCAQYMTSGLATVEDMIIMTPGGTDDPAPEATDPATMGRYLAVGKNADGNLWDSNDELKCNPSDCAGPVAPNNGVGGYYVP